MRDWTVEDVKRADMGEVLAKAYGLTFVRENGGWSALSPFNPERRRSFFVKQARDGHWLFKDFSSGLGGSLIDFVRHYEQLPDFRSAFLRTRMLLENGVEGDVAALLDVSSSRPERSERTYCVDRLYKRLRRCDANVCGRYLRERGIDATLVANLLETGTVVSNSKDGRTWCCFAVRDAEGKLRGLFNRSVEGEEKFLLGERWGFCLEWDRLAESERVYVCEGIIDALSLKSLLGSDQVVVALQGSHLSDQMAGLLSSAKRVIAAVDADEAGDRLWDQLCKRFDAERLERFDLEGCADPNELLQARLSKGSRGRRRLTAPEKVAIAFSPQPSRAVAAARGLHHSSVCQLRQEAQAAALARWEEVRPGPRVEPQDWQAKCAALEEQLAEVSRERDLLTMRGEWLELQLSWQRQQNDSDEKKSRRQERRGKGRRS